MIITLTKRIIGSLFISCFFTIGCFLKKAGINPEDYVTEDLVPPISTEYGTAFQVNCCCCWSCTTANYLPFKLFWWHTAICKPIAYPRISVCRPWRSTKFSGIHRRPWRTYCYGISIWPPDTNWWCTSILPADVQYELDHMLLQMMQKVIYFTSLLLSILLFDVSTNVGHHLYLAGIRFIHSISACRATARFSVHQHQQAIGKASTSNNSHQGRQDCSKEEEDCTRIEKGSKENQGLKKLVKICTTFGK